jgi:hypothetical protein
VARAVPRRWGEPGGSCTASARRGGGCRPVGVGGLPRRVQAARRLPMMAGSGGAGLPPRRARLAAPGRRLVTSGRPRRGMPEIRRTRAPGAPRIPKVPSPPRPATPPRRGAPAKRGSPGPQTTPGDCDQLAHGLTQAGRQTQDGPGVFGFDRCGTQGGGNRLSFGRSGARPAPVTELRRSTRGYGQGARRDQP